MDPHGSLEVDTAIGHNGQMCEVAKQRGREVPALIIPGHPSFNEFSFSLSSEPLSSAAGSVSELSGLSYYHNPWSSPQDQSPATSYTTSSDSPGSTLSAWNCPPPCPPDVPRSAVCDIEHGQGHLDWLKVSSNWRDGDCTSFNYMGLCTIEPEYLTGGMSDSNGGSITERHSCKDEEVLADLGSPIMGDTSSYASDWSIPSFAVCSTVAIDASFPSDSATAGLNGSHVHDPNSTLATLSYSCDIKQQCYSQYPMLSPIEYCPNTPSHPRQRIRTVGSPAITRASHMRREKPHVHHCPHCESSFTALHNLKNHVNSHLGIKPHTCGKCGRSFGTRHVLTRHCKKLCRRD
ncbi:hypothetical protein PM082_022576 [Marasmius tenuissimus]|nr:hypothetical protein PM082_022576 [Marasmius tenuissimus]